MKEHKDNIIEGDVVEEKTDESKVDFEKKIVGSGDEKDDVLSGNESPLKSDSGVLSEEIAGSGDVENGVSAGGSGAVGKKGCSKWCYLGIGIVLGAVILGIGKYGYDQVYRRFFWNANMLGSMMNRVNYGYDVNGNINNESNGVFRRGMMNRGSVFSDDFDRDWSSFDAEFAQMNARMQAMQNKMDSYFSSDSFLNGANVGGAKNGSTDVQSGKGSISFFANGKSFVLNYGSDGKKIVFNTSGLIDYLKSNGGASVDLKVLNAKGAVVREFNRFEDFSAGKISLDSNNGSYVLVVTDGANNQVFNFRGNL